MIGKVKLRIVETRVILATVEILGHFSKKELERYAKSIKVDPGKTKYETSIRLVASGKATILAQLGD